MRRDFLVGLALMGLTFCVYWSVRSCEFTNYDDTVYVTENGPVQDEPDAERECEA